MMTYKALGRMGRFANQLFQIAGTIGIAIKNNHPYCFPQWINHDHIERFGSTEDVDIYKHLVNPLPEFRDIEYQHVWIPWGYADYRFKPNQIIDLGGHMQSEKYFSFCIDVIRKYFTFTDEPGQNDFTAIHYRAGDYTAGKHTYHPRQEMDYYEQAMDKVKGDYLVFSDDLTEAKKMFGSNVTYAVNRDYLEDFKLMKKCKSFIGANSSFSLMAAILADHPEKQMVFPKLWFGEAAGGLSTTDLYPEGAIII
jgi:hypothetical protein